MIIARERQQTSVLTTLFGWFILYSSIGWIYETIYCYITSGKVINRGFLIGPICPIYGISILMMILLFTNRCRSLFSLFLSCSLVATALEYVSSYWMEVIFNRRWWNYYDMPFNIEGRVCLGASVLFGICGVLFVRLIHPAIVRFVDSNFSELLIRKVNRIILVIFLFDVAISLQISL